MNKIKFYVLLIATLLSFNIFADNSYSAEVLHSCNLRRSHSNFFNFGPHISNHSDENVYLESTRNTDLYNDIVLPASISPIVPPNKEHQGGENTSTFWAGDGVSELGEVARFFFRNWPYTYWQ